MDFRSGYARMQGKSYAEKLTILDEMERKGIPWDMRGKFYSDKGHSLVMVNDIKKGIEYLWKAVCVGETIDIFDQRCAYSGYLMAMHYLEDVTDEELRDAHFLYEKFFPNVVPFSHTWRDRKKLKIGYLGNNLSGCVESKFIVPLLAQYDRERYEVVLYDVHRGKKNWLIENFRKNYGSMVLWRDMGDTNIEEFAARIYVDGVDILVDLEGHTMDGITLQVAAYKPAPVQICGIGYFNTTGLPAIDYFLGDVYCDPPGIEKLFSEKVLRLPHSHLCYHTIIEPSKDPGTYQVHNPIVFASFNNFAKITDGMLDLWHRIIESVPGSRLLLKNPSKDLELVHSMHQRALQAGFREDQMDVRPSSGAEYYMDEYMEADIALDTYPYPGGGTTCDALYMGVPVVSLYGRRHGSRFGYSILSNAGIGELAASSKEEYVEKAVALALDSDLLTVLHHNLRKMVRNSPVMDGKRYIRDLEMLYEHVWDNYRRMCCSHLGLE